MGWLKRRKQRAQAERDRQARARREEVERLERSLGVGPNAAQRIADRTSGGQTTRRPVSRLRPVSDPDNPLSYGTLYGSSSGSDDCGGGSTSGGGSWSSGGSSGGYDGGSSYGGSSDSGGSSSSSCDF